MSERWMPEEGDYYYFVSTCGNALSDCFTKTDYRHFDRFVHGNCFKTIQEAASAGRKVRELMLSLHGESTTDCRQLPKLTTDVFDREDCPVWAKYAAVNANGTVAIFSDIPNCRDYGWSVIWHSTSTQAAMLDEVLFDASDWKNSLIKRPANLPDWCKVDEWVYIPTIGEYMQIKKVEDDLLFDKEGNHIPYTSCTPARPRPYNDYEMEALVGKVLKHDTGKYLVTAFENRWNQVTIESVWRDGDELLKVWTKLDGQPCGVLEHLNEEGEWVE